MAAKDPEHEFRGIRGSTPRHYREDEAGEIGMMKIGHGPPSPPFSLLRPLLCFGHLRTQLLVA